MLFKRIINTLLMLLIMSNLSYSQVYNKYSNSKIFINYNLIKREHIIYTYNYNKIIITDTILSTKDVPALRIEHVFTETVFGLIGSLSGVLSCSYISGIEIIGDYPDLFYPQFINYSKYSNTSFSNSKEEDIKLYTLFFIGTSLGSSVGVYGAGLTKTETGSFKRTLLGSFIGFPFGIVLANKSAFSSLFICPTIGAVIGFNSSRRYKSTQEFHKSLLTINKNRIYFGFPEYRSCIAEHSYSCSVTLLQVKW